MTLRQAFPACAAGALLLLVALGGCKGRTRDNVEPTGETVRVEINPQADTANRADNTIRDYADPAEPSRQ